MPRPSFAEELRVAVYDAPADEVRSILRSAGLDRLAVRQLRDGAIEATAPESIGSLSDRLRAVKLAALVVAATGRYEFEPAGWVVGFRLRPVG